MANQTIFGSIRRKLGLADTLNRHGAPAYSFTPRHALAQLAATGCYARTFYASGESQLEETLRLCEEVDDEFIARCAAHARRKGHRKDTPALLVAILAARRSEWLAPAFRAAIDNGRMVRNFVQIVRSGVTGRRSLGSAPRALVREWLNKRSDEALLRDSVGRDPSLADVIRLAHPRPESAARRALYGRLVGRDYDREALPECAAKVDDFLSGASDEVPPVPFTLLAGRPLSSAQWRDIASNAGWHATRMNLNTFARHDVFDGEDGPLTAAIAERLSDPKLIARSRVLPYQLLAAYRNVSKDVPKRVVRALSRAVDLATANAARVPGRVAVCPDVSGSMCWSVSGFRGTATSAVRCVDVAALVAAVFLGQRDDTLVLPFDTEVRGVPLAREDGVLANADRLARIAGGGTAVSAPLRWLDETDDPFDVVVLVSDNESWFDANGYAHTEVTASLRAWNRYRSRHPQARLVCLDIQATGTAQAPVRPDILHIGGFSDAVFEVVAKFAAGDDDGSAWTRLIEAEPLD